MRKYCGWSLLLLVVGLTGCRSSAPETEPAPSAADVAAERNVKVIDNNYYVTSASDQMPAVKIRDGARGLREQIMQFGNCVVMFVERNDAGCERMAAIVKQLAQARGVRMLLVYPTSDEVVAYGVGNFPTTILFLDGKEKRRWLREYREETFRIEFAKPFDAAAQ